MKKYHERRYGGNRRIFIDPIIETIKPYQDTVITRKNIDGKIFTRKLRDDSSGIKDYMKKQIYFVTKNIETLQLEFYSFAKFTDVGYNSGVNLYEFYLRVGGYKNFLTEIRKRTS